MTVAKINFGRQEAPVDSNSEGSGDNDNNGDDECKCNKGQGNQVDDGNFLWEEGDNGHNNQLLRQ
jgi:hypothetical protein